MLQLKYIQNPNLTMSTIITILPSLPFPHLKIILSSKTSTPNSFKPSRKPLNPKPLSFSVCGSTFFPSPRRGGGGGGGSGLLERPTFDPSQFNGPVVEAEEGGDIGKMRQRIGTRGGGSYRVLMVDDLRHTENLVAKVLPKAVPPVTSTDARNIFHKSRKDGIAIVLVTVKEHAEFYAHMMLRGGLKSAIEPDSDTQ